MTRLQPGQESTQAVPKRCAIYTRYSSDLQRPTSTEDQIRECKEECERHAGWIIAEEWVLSDEEVSGRSLVGRDALAALKEASKRKPRPFDCIIIDDTSRLGRNVPDVLKLAEIFEHHGVSIQFVSPPLSSSDPFFRQNLIFKAMMDEHHSVQLAAKVWRGLKGRVLNGYSASGACYGYKLAAVPDPTGKGDGVIGVDLEIVPKRAEVVREIFELYANGWSLDRIARKLRADGVPAPKPPRRNSVRGWSADGISEILRNKKYIGINEWGRTKNEYDPETGRMVTKRRPESEWVRGANPKWRIVSDELWKKVQDQLAQKRRLGIRKLGGLERTQRSQQYLFSGLVYCGVCGGPIRIVDADSDTVRYGCGTWRDKGACTNATRIRRDSLEEQLLHWLTHDLLLGDGIDGAVRSLYTKVQDRLAELQAEVRSAAVNVPGLRQELAERKQEAWNLTDYIIGNGREAPRTVRERLEVAEARIEQIEKVLARAQEPQSTIAFTTDQIKEYLLGKFRDLQSVLTSAPLVGKQILRKHIKKITLTPGEADGKRVFFVTIEFECGGGDSGVVLTDGVESLVLQYGFTTITIDGLVLDSSRVRRRPIALPPQSNNDNDSDARSSVLAALPSTQACDSDATAIVA